MIDRGFWYRVRTVLRKEVRDHRRDLRSVLLSLFFPLMAPIMLGVLLFLSTGAVQDEDRKADQSGLRTVVTIAGAENAPALTEFLETRKDLELKRTAISREGLEERVRSGTLPYALWVPQDAAGKDLFGIELLLNRSNTRSVLLTGQVAKHLRAFSDQQARHYLDQQGLDGRWMSPMTVKQVNLGEQPNIAGFFYRMVPPLILFMVFMGAVYLAIDVTVGERERGSLEPLLTAPLSRTEVLMGKAIAAFGFTAVVVAVNMTAFWVVLGWAAAGNPTLAAPPGGLVFLKCYVIAMPLVALAVAIQMSVAALTRSAKEAQIYLGLLPLIPMIPGLYLTFQPTTPGNATFLVPILGQLSHFLNLVSDKPLDLTGAALSTISTLCFAGLVFWLAARLFRQERFVFAK